MKKILLAVVAATFAFAAQANTAEVKLTKEQCQAELAKCGDDAKCKSEVTAKPGCAEVK